MGALVLNLIGLALCIIGLCLIRSARKAIESEGFQRTDISAAGDIRTRLARVEQSVRDVGVHVINVDTAIRQVMHSGQVNAIPDVGWELPTEDGRVTR